MARPPRRALTRSAPTAMPALRPPTDAQIKHVIPELEERWSRTTLKALDRAEQAIDEGNGLAAKYWGTFAGIGTDKILPIKGMPSTIVSNVHEYRADMSGLMDKLAVAARVLATHERKGYRQVGRVLSVDPVGQKDSVNITQSGILPDSDALSQTDSASGQPTSS